MNTHPQAQPLTIEQAIALAKSAIKRGDIAVALELYNAVLQRQPEHPVAKMGLRKLLKEHPHLQSARAATGDPAQEQINALVNLYQSGQMTKAEQACKELLKTYPQSLVTNYLLGAALQGQGKFQEALESCEKVIQLKPDFAEAYRNRGVALIELGQLERAVASCEKAIQIKPDYAEAYSSRGVALTELGQLKQAVESCERAIQLKPDFAEAHYNLANVLKDLGQLEKAVQSYEHAIQFIPDYAEAYCNRGNALRELGQLEKAAKSYELAIRFKPDFAEAYGNLGNALKDSGHLEAALESYEKAIQLKPDHAEAYSNRGVALAELGQLEQAVESCEQAIQLKPDYAEAYYNRGNALRDSGQLENAVESYEKAIRLKPDFAMAYLNLSTIVKYKQDDSRIAAMESLLADGKISEADRTRLSFALAKAYEDLDECDKSFDNLREGNRLRKKALNYHIESDRRLTSKIREVFSKAPLTVDLRPDSNGSIQPVFILGMPRSGTSLVEQILASHTKVHGAGELETMSKLASSILSKLPEQDTNLNHHEIPQSVFNSLRDSYLDALSALNVPEKIVTDKMPMNFMWVGFILTVFPEAKIIHLNRDAIATCWSIYKHHFASSGNGYAYDLLDLAEFYKLYIDLMSFWRERFPKSIYDLSYEDLTENQEEETRKLLAFCDLKWEAQCLDFHETKRAVKTASLAQVRQKMYKGSSEAWRKYEAHLQPLIKELQKAPDTTRQS